VAGVRGDGLDRALVAVEPEVVRALGLPPERVVEPSNSSYASRAAARVPRPVEDLVDVGHPELRVVDVALELAQAMGSGGIEPSACGIASHASFQPWL
jgi:hypothetical protein